MAGRAGVEPAMSWVTRRIANYPTSQKMAGEERIELPTTRLTAAGSAAELLANKFFSKSTNEKSPRPFSIGGGGFVFFLLVFRLNRLHPNMADIRLWIIRLLAVDFNHVCKYTTRKESCQQYLILFLADYRNRSFIFDQFVGAFAGRMAVFAVGFTIMTVSFFTAVSVWA